jgi:type I site-specific restriction endonuclease
MLQGLDYAATLEIPFVFSSNGDGFVFHDYSRSRLRPWRRRWRICRLYYETLDAKSSDVT